MSGWPRLTEEVPGCGGAFKMVPEDFEVEELPAYAPSGSGEHLYLWIEKRGRNTREVVQALATQLGVPDGEMGVAGLKDRQALSRQLVSVPARVEAKLSTFALPGVQVLWHKRHGNKLRTGHLKGNRFSLRLRQVRDPKAAEQSFALLLARGVPNYFGDQRFGRAGDNALQGKALLLGQRLPKRPDRFERRLFLSALQSLLFNRALAKRVAAGTFDRALPGDVLRKEDSGGLFLCEDAALDDVRTQAFEVSPAGPLFGPEMKAAALAVAEEEAQLLVEEGLTLSDFRRGGDETLGSRRPYRILLGAPLFSLEGEDLRLAFTLPRGAYASEVLQELLKEGQEPG